MPRGFFMRVINIKTEYLHNPLGLDAVNPRITWNVAGQDIKQISQ